MTTAFRWKSCRFRVKSTALPISWMPPASSSRLPGTSFSRPLPSSRMRQTITTTSRFFPTSLKRPPSPFQSGSDTAKRQPKPSTMRCRAWNTPQLLAEIAPTSSGRSSSPASPCQKTGRPRRKRRNIPSMSSSSTSLRNPASA